MEGLPKLKSFIEQKDGNYYIRLPKIQDRIALFPCLKELLTFKDGSFFLPVQEIIKVLNMFGNVILEKGGHYYVKSQELKTSLKSCTFDCLERKDFIKEKDGSYYVKILFELNCESNNFPENGIINLVEETGKYYIKVDHGNLCDEEQKELENVSTFLLIENTGYIQCP